MIATRPECGTGYGIRYHLAKDEPFCDLCTDHVMDRRLVRETAHKNGTTLKEEAVALGFVDEATFDAVVRPEQMVGPED